MLNLNPLTSDPRDKTQNKQALELHPLAKWIYENKLIFGFHGLGDGPDVARTVFSCASYFINGINPLEDPLHDWMLNLPGILTTVFVTAGLTALSFIGNWYAEKNKDLTEEEKKELSPEEIQRRQQKLEEEKLTLWFRFTLFIVFFWPYLRDVLKSFKTSYKGFYSLFKMIHSLLPHLVNLPVVAVALTFGIILGANRIWQRRMRENRKTMMDENETHYKMLQGKCLRLNTSVYDADIDGPADKFDASIDPQTRFERRIADMTAKISEQDSKIQQFAFFSFAVSGFIDSLYLYMGVMAMAAFVWPMIVAVAVCCILYSALCIIARVYEEWVFQKKLELTQVQIKYLLWDQRKVDDSQQLWRFANQLIELQSQSTVSAVLAGVQQGLAVYGAVCSLLFAVYTMLMLASVAFPPLIMAIAVFSGVLIIAGCIARSVYIAHQQRVETINEDTIKKLDKNKEISPPSRLLEGAETFRATCSGAGKVKTGHFLVNSLDGKGVDGHYHESPWLLGVMLACGAYYAIVLGLRAYARGFGKKGRGISNDDIVTTSPRTVADLPYSPVVGAANTLDTSINGLLERCSMFNQKRPYTRGNSRVHSRQTSQEFFAHFPDSGVPPSRQSSENNSPPLLPSQHPTLDGFDGSFSLLMNPPASPGGNDTEAHLHSQTAQMCR